MDRTELSRRLAAASRQLRHDMEALLPSREEQHERLERLIDRAGSPSPQQQEMK